ncbi:MAG: S41 family peptidase [Planctomycetota bacterium]|nr:S41 family peptidase [Planctomycetota bacterium]
MFAAELITSLVGRLRVPAVVLPIIVLAISAAGSAAPDDRNLARLEEVWRLVDEHFFDPEFNGVDWPAMLDRHAASAREADDDAELAAAVNAMLGELDTSHTRYFTKRDPAYYQLLGIFSHGRRGGPIRERFSGGEVRYADTGLVADEIDGTIFITGIIDGMPAADADLRIGDEIISVDGRPYEPRQSAAREAGPPLTIEIQRSPDPASRRHLAVRRELVEPNEMFLRAMRESARVIERDGVAVGYVHVWSWAGEHFQQQLIELLNDEPPRDAEALVLDIRDGWGGARTWYLNLFNRNVPVMTMHPREGEPHTLDMHWRKPVVLLINGGSRSGKEVIAWGFRTCDIGPVVGTPTAGAVTAGRAFILSDGSLLYLAVADVRVDGKRLEGVGVEPDVRVPREIPYAAGADPQLQRAVEVAAELARR